MRLVSRKSRSVFDRLSAPHVHMLTFLLRHLLIGFLAACVLGGAVLVTDFGGIASLIFASQDGLIGMFLLFFGLFITFGGMAMAWGIFSLGIERDQ